MYTLNLKRFSVCSKKSTEGQPEGRETPTVPQYDSGMVFEGANALENSGTPSQGTYIHVAIMATVTAVVSL